MKLNEQIASLAVEFADQKVPYRHRGMNRRGVDCTGLLVAVLQELDYLKDFILRKYPPQWNLHAGAGNQVIEELEKVAFKVPKQHADIGDIAVMLFGKCPAHCGIIVTEDLVFVHALKTNGYCKKSILNKSMWSSRWMATYRLDEKKLKCT